MKTIVPILLFCIISTQVLAQELGADYKITHVNQKVNQILTENPYESPLSNYVACLNLWARGGYDSIYSEMIDCSVQKDDTEISSEDAENLLNSSIIDVIIYKDSIGYVIRKLHNPSYNHLLIGVSVFENGKWKASGEDISFSYKLSDAYQRVASRSHSQLSKLRQYYRQAVVSQDTLAFTKYLQTNGSSPKEYLLRKLSNHKLVIYGEIHRRKLSWDYLKDVIKDPRFTEVCGTVFLELPTHTQNKLDAFLKNDKMDMEIILDILRNEQIYGWQDKGQYEFIEKVWEINNQTKNKIKIIATDFQIPWDSIRTNSDFENYLKSNMRDRDSTMANIILQAIKANVDTRNYLFIVGMNHARKSSPNTPIKAGTLLTERMPKEDIFSIMTHAMIGDNMNNCGQIRYGLYDHLFELNGNVPVAMDLKNSPFGKEPFDAVQTVRFEPKCGNFEDFYDGYIFLGALKDEECDYTLYDIYSDAFVKELKRRALITNSNMGWYDITIDELSKEKIINNIMDDQKRKNNRRWTE